MSFQDENVAVARTRIQLATQFSVPSRDTRAPIARAIRDYRYNPADLGAFYVLFRRGWLRKHCTDLPECLYSVYFKARPDDSMPGVNYTVPRVGVRFMLHPEGDNLAINGVKYTGRGYLTRGEITRLSFEGDRQIIALLPWAMSNHSNILTVARELTEKNPVLYIGPTSSRSLHHALLSSAYRNSEFTFFVGDTEHSLHRRGSDWLLDDNLVNPIDPSPYFFIVDQEGDLFIL